MIYETLYDWQKPFVDDYLDKSRWGYFLDMGIGKTKIMMSCAEKHNSDCIIVVTIASKVIEEEIDGSFACEAILGGYIPFYSHLLHKPKYQAELDKAIRNNEKICFICSYSYLTFRTRGENLGIKVFYALCQRYKNITLIFDEAHHLKNTTSKITKFFDAFFHNKLLPKLYKENHIRDNIKHIYMGTGTPFTVGYEDLYMLVKLLGKKWNYEEFKSNFCVIVNHQKFKTVGYSNKRLTYETIESYKNVDELFKTVNSFACFALTDDYYKTLPLIVSTTTYVRKSDAYIKMSSRSKKNKYYRVFDNFICDTPGKFKLRLRQLSSGFMGNSEEAKVYSYEKMNKLFDIINENINNYVIFYNYVPELLMIISACESAGYKYDLWNGETKSLTNYNDDTIKIKKVIIANVDSGKEGLNLPKYHHVIFFSLPDTWAEYNQSRRRIVRITSDAKHVFITNIIMTGTVEERIWNMLKIEKDYTDDIFASQYWENEHE